MSPPAMTLDTVLAQRLIGIQGPWIASGNRDSLVGRFNEPDTVVLAGQFEKLSRTLLLRRGNGIRKRSTIGTDTVVVAEVVKDLGDAVQLIGTLTHVRVKREFQGPMAGLVDISRKINGQSLPLDR